MTGQYAYESQKDLSEAVKNMGTNVIKSEEKEEWTYDGIVFKSCPLCKKGIPKEWEKHEKCGWNFKKLFDQPSQSQKEEQQEKPALFDSFKTIVEQVEKLVPSYSPEAKASLINGLLIQVYRNAQHLQRR